MARDPFFHAPIVVMRLRGGAGQQAHPLGKERRARRPDRRAFASRAAGQVAASIALSQLDCKFFVLHEPDNPLSATHRNTWAHITDQNETRF